MSNIESDHEFIMSLINKREVCKCEFCEVRLEEDELFEIGGYKLCLDCKAEYIRVENENKMLND